METRDACCTGGVLLLLASGGQYNTRLVFPFFKRVIPELSWWYAPFAAFVLTAESNAVNLTDGLDGLAISIFAIAVTAYTALAYVVGKKLTLTLTYASGTPELDTVVTLMKSNLAKVGIALNPKGDVMAVVPTWGEKIVFVDPLTGKPIDSLTGPPRGTGGIGRYPRVAVSHRPRLGRASAGRGACTAAAQRGRRLVAAGGFRCASDR